MEADPFPAWFGCYGRKATEKGTGFSDVIAHSNTRYLLWVVCECVVCCAKIMDEFRHCDFYTCPNGHLYVIGECRCPFLPFNKAKSFAVFARAMSAQASDVD